MFALVSEFSRPGAGNRIRSVFDRAQGTPSRHMVALWRLYLRYELWRGSPVNAKRVFYRGIAACPWSKQLWLDGLHWLAPLVPRLELRDMVQIIRTSRIRCHNIATPLLPPLSPAAALAASKKTAKATK
jgi:hypothetical protein